MYNNELVGTGDQYTGFLITEVVNSTVNTVLGSIRP